MKVAFIVLAKVMMLKSLSGGVQMKHLKMPTFKNLENCLIFDSMSLYIL